MTTPVKHKITILQGTTQRIPLSRQYVPYAITGNECAGYKNACTGAPVPPTDFHDEDYTGCEARMQMRAEIDGPVLWDMSTTNGRIELSGKTLTLVFDAVDSSAFTFHESGAMGQVEVTRPNGDVERHYALTFVLDRESTL
ncbi:conserved hypothetical protein [Acidovorax delafieldii 2AN]|jgi:hypothetical protein|uniref:Uncharacterized protein n=1 Tax=Acidovorax delafieldii 2AN TaxID=573060 RepID=C5T1W9_ACIDE|nr:hypothetical protein [Acidovorax delafieldii]EER61564.1 conserved hypothetical protein [Acidovorax delafieldii 2AN]